MKHQWVAYAIVALLSVGAGVAIAGLPNNEPVDPTIIPPTTTEPPTPTLATTTLPATTTTTPATTTTVPETTDAPTTVAPTSTVPELPPRSDLSVAVANGADVGGIATATAEQLETLGYVDVTALDGTVIADFTVVYFTPGLEAAAIRFAEDLGANPVLRAPLSEAPPVDGLGDVQLLAYLGQDRNVP
ncbi:MAG: LytR C-terminal domain-containing protein [Actinomycetota bacterium]